MKIKITIPLPEAIIELFDEDDILEAYYDGENLIVSTVDESDFDNLICNDDCKHCPFADECEDFIPCSESTDCLDCEYFCPHCGECIYDEEN